MRMFPWLWLAAFAVVFVPTLLVLKRRPEWRRRVTPFIPHLFIFAAACYGYLGARAPHESFLDFAPSLGVTASLLALGIRELVRQKKVSVTGPARNEAQPSRVVADRPGLCESAGGG